jgi:hypothetical protein
MPANTVNNGNSMNRRGRREAEDAEDGNGNYQCNFNRNSMGKDPPLGASAVAA